MHRSLIGLTSRLPPAAGQVLAVSLDHVQVHTHAHFLEAHKLKTDSVCVCVFRVIEATSHLGPGPILTSLRVGSRGRAECVHAVSSVLCCLSPADDAGYVQ